MSNNDFFEITKEAIKEISKDVYEDIISPVAKPTGAVLGLIPRAIKAALSPLEKWILQKEYNISEIQRLLEEKLKNVSPELIGTPEPYIAVPAIQYISYCMDNDELRNMYANLLASSMQKDIKDDVHPAYLEIIKQLCPDEAKILRYLLVHNTIPIIGIKYTFQSGEGGLQLLGFCTVAEMAKCDFPHNGDQYFDNLIRLGLVRESNNAWFFDQNRYEPILNDSRVQEWYNFHKKTNNVATVEYVKYVYEITTFCDRFFNICVDDMNYDIEE